MNFPVRLSFRDLGICETVESACWEQAGMLEPWADRISACHVTIERPTMVDRSSPALRVTVQVSFPDDEASARCEARPGSDGDPVLLVRDAFALLRRRLQARGGRRDRTGPLGAVVAPLRRLPTLWALTGDDHQGTVPP